MYCPTARHGTDRDRDTIHNPLKFYIMGKIFDNSVIDAKRENTKEKAARFDAAERERLAKQL